MSPVTYKLPQADKAPQYPRRAPQLRTLKGMVAVVRATQLLRPGSNLLPSERATALLETACSASLDIALIIVSGLTSIQTLFTGTVAKVASLVAVVRGGYGFTSHRFRSHEESRGCRSRNRHCRLAVNVLTWLWAFRVNRPKEAEWGNMQEANPRRVNLVARRSYQQSNLYGIAAEFVDCVSYVAQCGRFGEGRKIRGIIPPKGYKRVTEFQEHKTIFSLVDKGAHTHTHPQMFGTPTQLFAPSATTPEDAFVCDESMAIE
jgi:hypothetical protein